MWDTSQNKCIMFWKTTPNEIGNLYALIYQAPSSIYVNVIFYANLQNYAPFPSLSLSPTGSMCYCSGKLAVGSVSGTLALWGVGSDEGERGRETAPSLSQQTELKLDAGIFSLSFDQDMKLVSI